MGLVQRNRDQSLSFLLKSGRTQLKSPFPMYLNTTISPIFNTSTPSSSDPSDYNSESSTCYPTQPLFYSDQSLSAAPSIDFDSDTYEIFIKTTKKYKPVALKIKPVGSDLPNRFRIVRNIIGDPLAELPTLDPNPPPFTPTGRYTQERRDLFDKNNEGFLLPAECDLLHHFMMLHQDGFAWTDSERGHFREDFFPHTPWVQRNIPI